MVLDKKTASWYGLLFLFSFKLLEQHSMDQALAFTNFCL